MAKAADEMSHWAEYDYVVINSNIEHAFGQVRSILAAERLNASDKPDSQRSCAACSGAVSSS